MLRRLFVTSFDENKRIWSGISCNVPYNLNASVGEVILNMLYLMPEKVVQVNDTTSRKITATELISMIIRASQNFERLGYKKGDIIGFVTKDRDCTAPFIIGALLNGIIINPIAPLFDKDDIKCMFDITKPKAIFCDLDVYHTVNEAFDGCNIPIFITSDTEEIRPSIQEFLKPTGKEEFFKPPQFENEGDHIAAVLYTSGTEGSHKGVTITHRALLHSTVRHSFPSSTVMFTSANFYWVSGLITLVGTSLRCCTRIITEQLLTPEHLLYLIEKYRVTILFTTPSKMALTVHCQDVKTRDLNSLKIYICGGSPLPESLAAQMQMYVKNAQIVTTYGMTEIATSISMGFDQGTSVGQVAPNIRVKILDDDNNPAGIGETGEICVRTPSKLYGFYGNIEATKKIIDSNGWLCTGDVGYFDQEGSLHLVDRKKEIFEYFYYYLSPTEIEQVIFEIPDVVECCVFGVPDVITTNLAAAAIVKKVGSTLSVDDVHNYIAEKLKDYHKLRGGVFFVDSLPKTTTGKICRNQVRDILQERKQKVFV